MITIREKEILFIAINAVMFFSAISYNLMEKATMIGVGLFSNPNQDLYEGLVWILYTTSGTAIKVAAMITIVVDIWWLYRIVRDLQKGYWRENL